jgi:hypothetical protein
MCACVHLQMSSLVRVRAQTSADLVACDSNSALSCISLIMDSWKTHAKRHTCALKLFDPRAINGADYSEIIIVVCVPTLPLERASPSAPEPC